jgi:anti-sigma regulatory factor (Ser/Thr protein kinase)
MTAITRTFPGRLQAPGEVRAWLAGLLADCPVLDDVLLCASELVTNSVRYSRSGQPGGHLDVRIETEPGWVNVDVVDQGPAGPGAATSPGLGAGWPIVRELSDWAGWDGGRAWFVTCWESCPGCVGRGTGPRCCMCGRWIPGELRRQPGDRSEVDPGCPDCARGIVHTHPGLRLLAGGAR